MIDNRYVQLEYLESSGTQYIDTGIKAIANSKVEMKFNRTAYAGETNVSAVFGGYDSNQRNYGLAIDTTTIYWMFGGQSNAKKTFPLDTDYEVVFDGANKTFTIGDFTQSFSSLSLTAKSNGNIYLFTNSAVGSLSTYDKHYWLKGKIYYFKYYENGTLVRHLVPAKRKSDNVLGMFDKVNNVFYTNAGTGSFTGGKEIKEAFRSRIVPHAYRQLSYLESTGTQYIDTGLKGSLDIAVELKYRATTPAANNILNIFGDITTSTSALSCNTGYGGAPAQPTSRFGNKSTGAVVQNLVVNTDYTITTNKNTYTIKRQDGSVAYTYSYNATTSFTTTNNLWVFICNNNNAPSTYTGGSKFYYCKIWDNNVLVRNFIPVVRKLDNVAGMYDLVEGKFYGNAGTGSFIAGDIIKTVDKVKIDRYEFFDYLESTGTQWIDTGYIANLNSSVEMKFNVSSLNCGIFGSRTSASSNSFAVFVGTAGTSTDYVGTDFGNYNQTRAISSNKSLNADVIVKLSKNLREISTTTEVLASNTVEYSTEIATPTTCKMFKADNLWAGAVNMSGKIYSCKIYDNNTLVRNFYPAKRKSDGAIGMYDVVNDKLYTNAGTGEFTLGDKISITSYDKEFAEQYQVLDYIQNSGTQYIDTGILANGSFDADFKVNTMNAKNTVFAGARSTTQHLNFGQIDSNGMTGTFAYLNQYWSLGPSGVWASNTDYSIQVHVESGSQYIVINGTKLGVQKYTGVEKLDMNIHLFQRNFHTAGSDTLGKFAGRIYYFKLWNDGSLVRDYIPVKRRSDNAVGMYDKVTNTFFGNAGTDSFIAGNELSMPVKNEVNELRLPYNGNKYKFFDYIESSGTQWIDTGKLAPTNTDIEVRFSLNSVADGAAYNAAIFGGRNATTSKTCTLFYLATGKPHYFRFDRNQQLQFATATQITHNANDVYKFTFTNNVDMVFTNETTGETVTAKQNAPASTFPEYPIALFAVMTGTTASTFMSGRIYDWKYWNDGKLVQHLIPAQRLSDNAIGMFDKVTNTFFENKGTGVFVAGNEIVNIPNEYERLEYLQSSGTQYIDVDLSADSYGNNEMVVSLEYTDVTASQLFGANYGGYFGVKSGADYNVASKTIAVNTPYTYDIKRSGGRYTRILNGTSYSTGSIQTRATTSVYLFAIAGFTSMSYTKCKVKHFEYYVDGILVRNLFPVRRKADNVLGMLDLVNNVFYTNAGTGSFTTGTKSMPNKVMMPFWKRYPDVPSQYEVKEYLESDGYACINSGIRFTQGDKIDMVGRFIDPKHDDGLICMTPWNQGNSSRFMFACATTGGTPSFCMSYNTLAGGSNKVTPYFTPDTEYHRWTYEDLTLSIDGTSSLTNADVYPDDSKINGTVYLFRRFNGACAVAIKYYNHWRNGQLIASYVPVMRKSDGTLGMYDIVSDSFLTNVGTGSFTTNE